MANEYPDTENRPLIREAQVSDALALIKLNKEFNGSKGTEDDLRRVKKMLSNQGSEVVYVAEYQGRLVGLIAIQITRSFCYPKPNAEITELFVDKKIRRRKIASILVEKAVERAEKEDAEDIVLRVNRLNSSAIKFYEAIKVSEANQTVFRIRKSGTFDNRG